MMTIVTIMIIIKITGRRRREKKRRMIITIIIMIIIIIIIVIIIMIIIIALEGAIQIFTISSLRRELSPTRTFKWQGLNRVQITCNTSRAYHVQHVVCHVIRQDSSAIECNRDVISTSFYSMAKTINQVRRKGNRNTGRKALTMSFRKCHILKPKNSNRLVWPSGKASASREEHPGFESRLRPGFFRGRVIPVT